MAAPHLAVASAAALTVVTQSGRHQHTPVAVNGLCRRSLWTLPACPPAAFDGDTCYSGFCCPSCMSLGHGCCNSTAIQRLGTLHRPAAAWLQQQHPLALHSSSASASLATADPKRHPPDCGGQQLGSCRVAMFSLELAFPSATATARFVAVPARQQIAACDGWHDNVVWNNGTLQRHLTLGRTSLAPNTSSCC